MSKTLILTGWGHKDYACGAALALRHYKQADILGISKRRLPEFLENVSGCTEIVILGVSLTGDAERLATALKSLKERKVLVHWISVFDFPKWMGEDIKANLASTIFGSNLLEAVSETFGLPHDDLLPLYSDKEAAGRQYSEFLEAAMYFYRNYQDEQAYPRVIRHLAATDPESKWTDAERQMIAHYRCYGGRELIGKSDAISHLREQIDKVAQHPRARVLILGESGTGKETIAFQIHFKSARRAEPFIAFNCASVSPNLLEASLLGYAKGAFTGGDPTGHAGIFETADGGTVFLDEIAELPLEAQGILLRVLEGGRFQRISETREVEVNVRVIAATNRDLAALVSDGRFREDLFQRLNVIQLRAPALREHKEDIPAIARSYRKNNEMPGTLTQAQNEALLEYDYPGNVRELNNLLERAEVMELSDYRQLIREHKEMNASLARKTAEVVPDNLEEATRLHIKRVCEKCNGNITKAAEALGASRNTVRKYLEGKGE
ncbi:MAG: sigma-54 dependent transcriptional regulator [Lentisphaeria bacterium]